MTAPLPTPTSSDHLTALGRRAPGARDPVLGLPIDWGEWRPIACYPPTTEDGREVTVSVSRAPAAFYRITCPAFGLDLSTGSGPDGARIANEIAVALAGGMLGPATKED